MGNETESTLTCDTRSTPPRSSISSTPIWEEEEEEDFDYYRPDEPIVRSRPDVDLTSLPLRSNNPVVLDSRFGEPANNEPVEKMCIPAACHDNSNERERYSMSC